MRSMEGRLSAAVCAGLLVACASRGEDTYAIGYRFSEGTRSISRIDVEASLETEIAQGGQKQTASTETTLGLIMDVTEREVSENAVLAVTFRELSVDQKLSGPAGETSLAVSGGDVVVKRDGVTVVDTKETKGKELAAALLREFAFVGEEGKVTVEPTGRVAAVEGPEAFKSFLAQESGWGLWDLETKPEAVAVGETWTSSERRIGSLRGLDLSANPLTVRLSYTLEEVNERDGAKVAKIAVKSELVRKDLSAKVSGEALRDIPVIVNDFRRTASGTVLFDLTAGRLLESDLTVDLGVGIEMKVKNEKTRAEETAKISVSGRGRVRLALQGAPQKVEEEAGGAPEDGEAAGGAEDAPAGDAGAEGDRARGDEAP